MTGDPTWDGRPTRKRVDRRSRCACGSVATGPAGPTHLEGEDARYVVAAGDPLCPPCSERVWRAYLAARRERLDLIAYAATHPGATRADLARARERERLAAQPVLLRSRRDVAERAGRLLRAYGPASARDLAIVLERSPSAVRRLLREIGAHRVQRRPVRWGVA